MYYIFVDKYSIFRKSLKIKKTNQSEAIFGKIWPNKTSLWIIDRWTDGPSVAQSSWSRMSLVKQCWRLMDLSVGMASATGVGMWTLLSALQKQERRLEISASSGLGCLRRSLQMLTTLGFPSQLIWMWYSFKYHIS